MFRHLLKLIWNRKASHGLIIAEITIAFLVIFGISALSYHYWHLYQQPLGFKWENALQITIRNGGDWTEKDGKNLEQAVNVLRGNSAVESANAVRFGPFMGWRSIGGFGEGEKQVSASQNIFEDGTHDAMGLKLLEGRWTSEQDIGLDWDVAVINKRLSEELFTGESPLGKNIRLREKTQDAFRELRVVGVFEEFRQMGEFTELSNYVIHRFPMEAYDVRAFSMMIYTRPNAPLSLQEDIVKTLHQIAPGWTVSIRELSASRKDMLDEVITPLLVMALVAGFLILMVGFGLFGVLWQSVTRRTSELGLRRAMGASKQHIYRQIVAEMALAASIALSIGVLIAVQFPMLGTFKLIDWPAAIGGMLISGTLVLSLCFLCSLYPGWLASRRSPADALHYE